MKLDQGGTGLPSSISTLGRGEWETRRFQHAADELIRRGITIPCVGGALWLSEDQAERSEAMRLCGGCLLTELCGDAADARSESFGVWAGKDYS